MLSIDVILCVVIEYKIIYHLKEGAVSHPKSRNFENLNLVLTEFILNCGTERIVSTNVKMALFRNLTNVLKRATTKTLVGADKEGNKFFTYEDPNGMIILILY